MRTVVIGAEDFGYRCIGHLLEMGVEVDAIFTARKDVFFQKMAVGMDQTHYSPLESLAVEHDVPIFEIGNINHESHVRKIEGFAPDLIAVFGWSQIISDPILKIPPLGVIGFHPSFLPKRRGRAPINWAIIDGLTSTAQTMFYYTKGADEGDIIAQWEMPIEFEDTCKTLYDRGTELAMGILTENFPLLAQGTAPRIPQDHAFATYTPGRKPEEGLIDWAWDTLRTYNLVRGVTKPYPGAFTFWGGKQLIIWRADPVPIQAEGTQAAGDVLEVSEVGGIVVKTGDGALQISEVNFDGGDCSAAEFARSHGVSAGSNFTNSPDRDLSNEEMPTGV